MIQNCQDVFDASQHGNGLVNIVTGKIVNKPEINVDDSVRLGKSQMEEFSKNLPNGFYETMSKRINNNRNTQKLYILFVTSLTTFVNPTTCQLSPIIHRDEILG